MEKYVTVTGWLCRDKRHNSLLLHSDEPYRIGSGYNVDGKEDVWESDEASFFTLDSDLFPEITWESEPVKVKLTISVE